MTKEEADQNVQELLAYLSDPNQLPSDEADRISLLVKNIRDYMDEEGSEHIRLGDTLLTRYLSTQSGSAQGSIFLVRLTELRKKLMKPFDIKGPYPEYEGNV